MSDSHKATLDTPEQKVSYGFGLQFGQQLIKNNFEGLDIHAVFTAMHHMVNANGSAISEVELNAAYEQVEANEKAKAKAVAEQSTADGQQYLLDNAKKDGVQTTASGIQYHILQAGIGSVPQASNTVRTHYHGTFVDGTVFDSSVDRGEPAEFGVREVIPGWTEILQMMPVGSKWQIVVPSHLAYGPNGAAPVVPPNATLCFDIELLAILADDE